jgi:acyl-CoA synthetase (NDP forming)
MLSQSGALGIAILDYVGKLDAGISTFVSVGNKADVSSNDLLAFWEQDPNTAVIVLYLESFGNPRRFARIAPEVARQKPIVAVKSGRSAAGTRAAASHSAALASLDVAVDALFEQAGVIRTSTLEELFDVAVLLATQPTPAGRRVGVVTNAGGPGILLADACEAQGLELPQLAAETLQTLRGFLPAGAGLSNPIDMIASASPEHYERTLAAVGNDPNVDAIVVVYIPLMVTDPQSVAAGIARGAAAVPEEKPILNVFLSSKQPPVELGGGPRGRLPCFTFPENAAMALAAAERYGRWRRRPEGTPHRLDHFTEKAVRAVIERVVPEQSERCWLQPNDVALILRLVGIEYAHSEQASVADAVEVGDDMGYPLVAKAIAKGLVHKSDIGGVVLGIDSRPALEAAVRTLGEKVAAAGSKLDGVLLQREVPGGIEALVGVTTDATFGPLVVCGLGGVMVEVFRDAGFALTPVTDVVAGEMTHKLRASKLLDGFRGAPPGDRAALADVILRVSALVEAVPELCELDLNPVKVLEPGKGAVVVDARIRVGPTG